jgi:RsiW-degrading membrane proteinase PrsW (M82 family)
MSEQQSSAKAMSKAHRIVRATFVTEESVYGVLLVSGMIVASGGHGESSWRVFWSVAVTVVVFWAAHVYAGTVAHHGLDNDRLVGLRESFRIALLRSRGLLLSSAIPLAILLMGAAKAIPDKVALWAALWAGVVVLAVLGFIAFRRRGAWWPVQILGSLITAGFGVALIVLKSVVH